MREAAVKQLKQVYMLYGHSLWTNLVFNHLLIPAQIHDNRLQRHRSLWKQPVCLSVRSQLLYSVFNNSHKKEHKLFIWSQQSNNFFFINQLFFNQFLFLYFFGKLINVQYVCDCEPVVLVGSWSPSVTFHAAAGVGQVHYKRSSEISLCTLKRWSHCQQWLEILLRMQQIINLNRLTLELAHSF